MLFQEWEFVRQTQTSQIEPTEPSASNNESRVVQTYTSNMGLAVQSARIAMLCTLGDVAGQIGVSESVLRSYEMGECVPPYSVMTTLESLLKVTLTPTTLS